MADPRTVELLARALWEADPIASVSAELDRYRIIAERITADFVVIPPEEAKDADTAGA